MDFSFKGRFLSHLHRNHCWRQTKYLMKGYSRQTLPTETTLERCAVNQTWFLFGRGAGGVGGWKVSPTALEVSKWRAHLYMNITIQQTWSHRLTHTSQGNSDKRRRHIEIWSDWLLNLTQFILNIFGKRDCAMDVVGDDFNIYIFRWNLCKHFSVRKVGVNNFRLHYIPDCFCCLQHWMELHTKYMNTLIFSFLQNPYVLHPVY